MMDGILHHGGEASGQPQIVIFAGTTEGRLLAERLAADGVEVIVCVATEYGEKLMPEQSGIQVHSGRMNAEEMTDFLRQKMPCLVVDATHPYARTVTETIKKVCKKLRIEYVRLLRAAGAALPADGRIHLVEDARAAAELAERMSGNIFLATGSRELAVFAGAISDFSRLYARVLPAEESFELCKKAGFEGKQLICMQGPFSEELNRAMYAHVNAKILVTKESGDAGGCSDKVQAALAAGMHCIVIRRPKEQGMTFEQVCQRLGVAVCSGAENGCLSGSGAGNGCLTESGAEAVLMLVGIGMGAPEQMTLEAHHALKQAQVIFGAKRMLETVREFPAQKVCEYRMEEIAAYLSDHPQFTRAAVVFSGDVGFYSGAGSFGERLDVGGKSWVVQRIAGISAVNDFAAKLGVPWQDATLCSVHGRDTDLQKQIMEHQKVFSLFNDGEQLRKLAGRMSDHGMDQIRLSVGFDLGYETEEIWQGFVYEFLNRTKRKGLCVALFENEHAGSRVTTGNLPDAAFQRGTVPLTKEEIRAVALSKLQLSADAVCYDIGAGTGGMTMDIARFVPDGRVIAFERSGKACELIRANAERFSAAQVTVVRGAAPEILETYEPPTHAFIGGSGGRLREIIEVLLTKNPCMRIVVDAVTLETVGEANAILKTLPVKDVDIVSVTAAKAKNAGEYHLMEGMNPVYIFSFTGAGCDRIITDIGACL